MSRIPQIPEPVPFEFHGRTDYTTVYKAVDFPLDHFAIFKQNPVNRDRMTEANKLLYSLQKQINDLRQTVIALAVEMDENVEKKVQIRVEMGNEVKEIEASLLKDTYTFTIPAVSFGEESEISITAKVDDEMFLVSSDEVSCAEGADVEIKATAQKEEGHIVIKKSEEPAPSFTLTGKLLKAGAQEETDITFTITDLTATATVDALGDGDKITLTLSSGYAFDPEPEAPAVGATDLSFTVKVDETVTEETVKELTVQA